MRRRWRIERERLRNHLVMTAPESATWLERRKAPVRDADEGIQQDHQVEDAEEEEPREEPPARAMDARRPARHQRSGRCLCPSEYPPSAWSTTVSAANRTARRGTPTSTTTPHDLLVSGARATAEVARSLALDTGAFGGSSSTVAPPVADRRMDRGSVRVVGQMVATADCERKSGTTGAANRPAAILTPATRRQAVAPEGVSAPKWE